MTKRSKAAPWHGGTPNLPKCAGTSKGLGTHKRTHIVRFTPKLWAKWLEQHNERQDNPRAYL